LTLFFAVIDLTHYRQSLERTQEAIHEHGR